MNDYGTIVYEETYGFPIEVPVAFDSDFVAADDEGSAGNNEVYFFYEVSGTGATYYSADSMSVTDDAAGDNVGEVEFTLTKNGDVPPVGTYGVTIAVNMMMKSTCCADILQDFKAYTITVNVQGSETTQTVSTQGATGTFTEQTLNGSHSGTTTSTLPTGLGVSQSGGPVAYPNDLTIVASTSDIDYALWLDSTFAVKAYNDEVLSGANLVYEWPSMYVTAPTSEGTADGTLTIDLENVPVGLYNLGTVWLKIQVYYRDTTGDRRILSLPGSIHRGLERKGAVSHQLSAKVELDDESAPDIIEDETSQFEWTAGVIVGISAGCGIVLILMMVLVCHRRMKNKESGTQNTSNNDEDSAKEEQGTVDFELGSSEGGSSDSNMVEI